MKGLAAQAMLTAFIVALALIGYDRLVFRPSQTVGIVDVSAVYRQKEAEFARIVTKSQSDAERQNAMAMAGDFAKRLPEALDELPRECGCLVVLRSAVAGSARHTVDLTELLLKKVNAR